MAEITVNKDNFEKEVLNSDKITLVDFWADWCGPCKMMGPVVAEIAKECEKTIKVCKVNVDDEPTLSMQFNIDAIPCFIVFKNGKPESRKIGYCNKQDLLEICK